MSRMLEPEIEGRTERDITLDPEIEEFGDYLGYGLFVFFAILDTLYLGFISLATAVHVVYRTSGEVLAPYVFTVYWYYSIVICYEMLSTCFLNNKTGSRRKREIHLLRLWAKWWNADRK